MSTITFKDWIEINHPGEMNLDEDWKSWKDRLRKAGLAAAAGGAVLGTGMYLGSHWGKSNAARPVAARPAHDVGDIEGRYSSGRSVADVEDRIPGLHQQLDHQDGAWIENGRIYGQATVRPTSRSEQQATAMAHSHIVNELNRHLGGHPKGNVYGGQPVGTVGDFETEVNDQNRDGTYTVRISYQLK